METVLTEFVLTRMIPWRCKLLSLWPRSQAAKALLQYWSHHEENASTYSLCMSCPLHCMVTDMSWNFGATLQRVPIGEKSGRAGGRLGEATRGLPSSSQRDCWTSWAGRPLPRPRPRPRPVPTKHQLMWLTVSSLCKQQKNEDLKKLSKTKLAR